MDLGAAMAADQPAAAGDAEAPKIDTEQVQATVSDEKGKPASERAKGQEKFDEEDYATPRDDSKDQLVTGFRQMMMSNEKKKELLEKMGEDRLKKLWGDDRRLENKTQFMKEAARRAAERQVVSKTYMSGSDETLKYVNPLGDDEVERSPVMENYGKTLVFMSVASLVGMAFLSAFAT